MYYKALKDIKYELNKRYILLYRDFFFNNKNNYYIVCENVNFEAREQLFLLRKLKAYCDVIKLRKKVFLSMLLHLSILDRKKIRNFFLYNPLILKIHKNNFLNFVNEFLVLRDNIIKYNKRERRFFNFTVFFYQMNNIYSFSSFLKNLNLIKSNNLNNIFMLIFKVIFNFLSVVFSLFTILFFIINLKQKNAYISSIK